jgi:Meiosis protein SPO22/ZIP4 like
VPVVSRPYDRPSESNVERLAHLSARDVCASPFSPHVRYPEVSPLCLQRELLASKVLEIGRSLLTGCGRDNGKKIDTRAEEAVSWLQKAFSLAERLDDTLTAGATELKVGLSVIGYLWLIKDVAVSATNTEKSRFV